MRHFISTFEFTSFVSRVEQLGGGVRIISIVMVRARSIQRTLMGGLPNLAQLVLSRSPPHFVYPSLDLRCGREQACSWPTFETNYGGRGRGHLAWSVGRDNPFSFSLSFWGLGTWSETRLPIFPGDSRSDSDGMDRETSWTVFYEIVDVQ